MRKRYTLILFSLFIFRITNAQETFPLNGVQDTRPNTYIFTNAKIVVNATTKIDKASLLISNGTIVAVGASIPTPKGAIVVNCEGKTIYPSFIDINTTYGMPEAKRGGRGDNRGPQFISNKKGAYSWNEAIRPEFDAKTAFKQELDIAFDLCNTNFAL